MPESIESTGRCRLQSPTPLHTGTFNITWILTSNTCFQSRSQPMYTQAFTMTIYEITLSVRSPKLPSLSLYLLSYLFFLSCFCFLVFIFWILSQNYCLLITCSWFWDLHDSFLVFDLSASFLNKIWNCNCIRLQLRHMAVLWLHRTVRQWLNLILLLAQADIMAYKQP